MSDAPTAPTLRDAFDIPEHLGDFVVRVNADPGGDAALVRDYVITPGVATELGRILQSVQDTQTRGEDLGWIVHGSFGSGKSHFLAVLSLLLENQDLAWAKPDPAIAQLAERHRPWLAGRRLLVVRENLSSADHKDKRFDRIIYEAVNKTLAAAGQAPFSYLNLEGVLEQARQEAGQYGDAFWKGMAAAGVIDSATNFELVAASADIEDVERLAYGYLTYKGRDGSDVDFSPKWAEGLQRLTRHVQGAGYGGLVLILDEMLLWLSATLPHQFKEAINQLTVIVDHTDGARALPVSVFVARQRRFSEFFPDMADDEQLQDHLDFQSGRFKGTTTLEDVELRHIVKDRVLRQRQPAAIAAAVEQLLTEKSALRRAIQQDADGSYLRDVYPYHPALIEALIDISSLLQRDRTALRLLTELLMQSANLPLGQVLPVGAAFQHVFPRGGFLGHHRVDQLRAIQDLYYQRFQPAIAAIAQESAESGTDSQGATDRDQGLDQMVKTVLMAEVSKRLKGASGLTLERLVRLNDADVSGFSDRGRIATAFANLLDLSRRVPALQISGEGGSAIISVITEGADFGDILERARGHAENLSARFRAFYSVFKPILGLDATATAGRDGAADWPLTVTWRGTQRQGSLKIANVRELPYDDFKVRQGDFRILIDYPWDEPGHSVEEDRQRVQQVKKAEGSQHSLCWLPRHLPPAELAQFTDIAACDFIMTAEGQESLLGGQSPQDRQSTVERAKDRAATLRRAMADLLRRAYVTEGEVQPLVSDLSGVSPKPEMAQNTAYLASVLLDRRYPRHPDFKAEPRLPDLRLLLDWMLQAAETDGRRAPYDDNMAALLRSLGEPLDLVSLGQTHANLRLDTRYVKDVLDRFERPELSWGPVDSHLQEHYGLQPALRNLFLLFAMRLKGYRALHELSGAPVETIELDNRPHGGLSLVRAPLLDPATWSAAMELGGSLFGLPRPASLRVLSNQDAWSRQMRAAGQERRQLLGRQLGLLGQWVDQDAPRCRQLRTASERLVAVEDGAADSFKVLSAMVAAWPADSADPLRDGVRDAAGQLAVLQRVDLLSWQHLQALDQHSSLSGRVQSLMAALRGILASDQALQVDAIEPWNVEARDLVMEALRPTGAGDGGHDRVEDEVRDVTKGGDTEPFEATGVVFTRSALLPGRGALAAFCRDLEAQLASAIDAHPTLQIEVTVRNHPDDPL